MLPLPSPLLLMPLVLPLVVPLVLPLVVPLVLPLVLLQLTMRWGNSRGMNVADMAVVAMEHQVWM